MTTRTSDLTLEELKQFISEAVKEALEDNIEEILALNNPKHLEAIREGREDVKAGRVTSMEDMMGV